MVIDPAPAATNGRNSLSHRAPPPGAAAITPVKINAAATGVPNSAPIVAAAAMAMISSAPTFGQRRATSAMARAELMAMMGFSGPRLTPPARVSTTARRETGQGADRQWRRRQLGGGGVPATVAGQLPDHQSDGRTGQRQHQEDPPAGSVRDPERGRREIPECVLDNPRDLVQRPQDESRQHADEHRGDGQQQQLPRRGSRRRRRRDLTHAAILVIGRPDERGPLPAPAGLRRQTDRRRRVADESGPGRMRQSGAHRSRTRRCEDRRALSPHQLNTPFRNPKER